MFDLSLTSIKQVLASSQLESDELAQYYGPDHLLPDVNSKNLIYKRDSPSEISNVHFCKCIYKPIQILNIVYYIVYNMCTQKDKWVDPTHEFIAVYHLLHTYNLLLT